MGWGLGPVPFYFLIYMYTCMFFLDEALVIEHQRMLAERKMIHENDENEWREMRGK